LRHRARQGEEEGAEEKDEEEKDLTSGWGGMEKEERGWRKMGWREK